MYGFLISRKRAMAAEVFAICISEKMPSCMRAPPEALNTTAAQRRSVARSKMRVTFSPTTEPIEPPMNSKTKAPTDTGCPSIRPIPPTKASFSLRARRVERSRSR